MGGGDIIRFFLVKSDGGLDIYSNFSKIIIDGISNVRWVVIVSLLTVIVVGEIWLKLF